MAVVTWKEDFNNLTNWTAINPLGTVGFGYSNAVAYEINSGKLAVGTNNLNQGMSINTGSDAAIDGPNPLNSIRFGVKFNPRPTGFSSLFSNRIVVVVRGLDSGGNLSDIEDLSGPEVRMAIGVDGYDNNLLQFQRILIAQTGTIALGSIETRTVSAGDWVEFRLWRDTTLENVIYSSTIVNGVEVDLGYGAYDMSAFRLPDWPYGWGVHVVLGTGIVYPTPGDDTNIYLDYLYLNDIGNRPNYTPNITGRYDGSTTNFTGSR